MTTHAITLDMRKRAGSAPRRVTVRVGDVETQTIEAKITLDGAQHAPQLANARLDILHQDGTWARCAAVKKGDTVTCELPAKAVSSCGRCKLAHFVFHEGAKAESTEGFELVILPAVDTSDDHQEAQNYDDLLTKLWEKWSALEAEASKAEAARVKAESARVAAEAKRAQAETGRAGAESSRENAENTRKQAESARLASEKQRETAEQGRVTAETARVASETQRAAAESARAKAESERATQQVKNNADQAANNAAAQGLQVVKLTEGQFDHATLMPTVQGEVGKLYFVPIPSQAMSALSALMEVPDGAGADNYLEWMAIDGKWERVGMSNATLVSLTTDEIDRIAGGEQLVSESVLGGTGLSYLWSKIKGAFAPITHGHPTSDVTGLDTALGGKATKEELKALRDSLSQTPRVFCGSKVIRFVGGQLCDLFSADEFKREFGRAFDNARDSVSVMNGDYGPYNQPVQVMHADSRPGIVTVWAPRAHTGPCRVNYIVVLAP